MRVRHERRELVLHAEELVDRIIVPLPFLAFDLPFEEPFEHVRGKFLRRRLPIQRIFAQFREILFPAVDNFLLMRRRFVAEFAVVAGDAELLDQSERREQFRFAENQLPRKLFRKRDSGSRAGTRSD